MSTHLTPLGGISSGGKCGRPTDGIGGGSALPAGFPDSRLVPFFLQ